MAGMTRGAQHKKPLGIDAGRFIAPAVNLIGVVLVALSALYLAGELTSAQPLRVAGPIGILALVTVLLWDARAGILLWVAMAPFARLFNFSMGHGLPDLGLNRVAALTLVLLLLPQVANGKRRLKRPDVVEVAGVLFALGMLASVPASRLGLVSGVQNVFDTVLLPLLCYVLARNLLNSDRQVGRLALVFALVLAMLGIIAAREQLTNQPILSPVPYRWAYGEHSVKVTSLFGAPATMSLTTVMALPLAFAGFARSRGLVRWFCLAALLCAAAGLLLTYVRAGWLTAILAILLVVLLAPRARRVGWMLLPVVLIVALLVFSGGFDIRAITERLQSDGPINYRLQALEVGFQLAARSPVFGLGLDSYSDAALAAGWRPRGETGLPSVAPHNHFIYVLTSAGLVGLLPLLFMLAGLVWLALRLYRRSSPSHRDWLAALLATLFAYVLFANTFDVLAAQLASILLMLLAGATIGAAESAVEGAQE